MAISKPSVYINAGNTTGNEHTGQSVRHNKMPGCVPIEYASFGVSLLMVKISHYSMIGTYTVDDHLTPFALKLLRARVMQARQYVVRPAADAEVASEIGTIVLKKYKVCNVIYVHHNGQFPEEQFVPPWHIAPPKVRQVYILEFDGSMTLYCSGVFCRTHGLPCVHTLAVNGGAFGFTDFHPKWFIHTNLGTYDCCQGVVPVTGTGHYYMGPALRVKPDAFTQCAAAAMTDDLRSHVVRDDLSTSPSFGCPGSMSPVPGVTLDDVPEPFTDAHWQHLTQQSNRNFYQSGLAACKEILAQVDRLPGMIHK